MRTCQTEFPDFDGNLAEVLAKLGGDWIDSSWHNDSCPSVWSESRKLHLFVDYVNPALRELSDVPRFALIEATGSRTLMASDDLEAVKKYLATGLSR